jgi:hypothetical protein
MKVRKRLSLGQEEAAQALRMLISEGRVATRELRAMLRRQKLIERLRRRLAALEAEGFAAGRNVRRSARHSVRRAKRQVSAARRAAMKAQGKYLAAVRRLPKAARNKMRAIRERSGVNAAIAAARRLASP